MRCAQAAWAIHGGKRGEICDTRSWLWGYHENNLTHHIGTDAAMGNLVVGWRRDCNLLLNTGPEPDGTIPAPDVATLREMGARIRTGDLPDEACDAFASTLPASAPIT